MLVELGCAELGVAWQRAKLPVLPALFAARGADRATDRVTPTEALARLRAAGLIDQQGELAADLLFALTAFCYAPYEVDLRFAAGQGPEVRAVVTVHEGSAVLAEVTGGRVRLCTLPAESAIPALVHVLPPVEPARGAPVSLPVAEVDAAITRSMEVGQDSDDGVVGGLTARGVAGVDARLFVSLVGSKRLRFAEFGVTVRDWSGARHRSCRTVQAVDMRRGRAVLYTRGDYLVATPADQRTIIRVLTEVRDAELDRGGRG